MKRALAERAKQSETTHHGPPPSSASGASATAQQPPRKIPRIHDTTTTSSSTTAIKTQDASVPPMPQQQSQQQQQQQRIKVEPISIPSQATTTTTTGPSPLGTPREKRSSLKRQRSTGTLATSSTTAADNNNNATDNDDDGNASCFYLKHQNRALASELKGLQYQLRLLEEERNVRRQQCQEAARALQDLHKTWRQMEVALQLGTPPPSSSVTAIKVDSQDDDEDNKTKSSYPDHVNASHMSIRNTGTGDSVELIGSLLDSLASLGKATTTSTTTDADADTTNTAISATTTKENDDNDNNKIAFDASVREELVDLKQVAVSISQRAAALQSWIWTLLQRSTTPSSSSQQQQQHGDDDDNELNLVYSNIESRADLEGQVVALQRQCRNLEMNMAELATTKQEAVASDFKVRKGLYRLAAGRMKLDEVLKTVEENDRDGTSAKLAMEVAQEGLSSSTTTNQGGETAATVTTTTTTTSSSSSAQEHDEVVVDGAQVLQLKKQLQDLQEIASTRKAQIEQLLKDRENDSKRINSLSVPDMSSSSSQSNGVLSEQDIRRTSLYTDTATKLVTAERQLDELRMQMEKLMTKYATAKGDAELATKTLEEHMASFQKRWAELSLSTPRTADTVEKKGNDYDDLYADADKNGANRDDGDATPSRLLDSVAQAKRIVELEHKLKQALESVRQTDTVRVSLTEAQRMNETISQQLEEYKAKYATVMAGRTASRSSSENALSSKDKSSSSSTPISADRAEKLHRENRRMKKDLASAIISKESAKAKQDKAEKERDGLLETNARLLKQNMEKDDMNAKSLATILHLKSLTEQAETERLAQEREAKSAEQVALASRLAENARERVAEEALKEKKLLEDRVTELEKECDRVKREKEVADGALSQTRAEMSSMESNVGTLKDRCEELTIESARLAEEKQKLGESLAVAQREAVESSNKLLEIRNSSGVGASGFTAEQLETQVSVLKNRLTCPVCNHRDKACILTRCRHMFCKQCVEENIKNRSRKCPACGQRFDNKDVHDIFL